MQVPATLDPQKRRERCPCKIVSLNNPRQYLHLLEENCSSAHAKWINCSFNNRHFRWDRNLPRPNLHSISPRLRTCAPCFIRLLHQMYCRLAEGHTPHLSIISPCYILPKPLWIKSCSRIEYEYTPEYPDVHLWGKRKYETRPKDAMSHLSC
jgi:hypothetical protein